MSVRFVALLCLTGAAACSHQSTAANDPSNVDQTAATSTETLTPASLENDRREPVRADSATPATASTPTPSRVDGSQREEGTRAPLVADTKGTSSNDFKNDAPATKSGKPSDPVQPDNTKVNERDTNAAAPTPTDQRENETDLKITQHIRQAVMADGNLSFTAKNVKIITQGGKVTLRGPVKTDQERSAIEALARKVAGVSQIDNQIEVKK